MITKKHGGSPVLNTGLPVIYSHRCALHKVGILIKSFVVVICGESFARILSLWLSGFPLGRHKTQRDSIVICVSVYMLKGVCVLPCTKGSEDKQVSFLRSYPPYFLSHESLMDLGLPRWATLVVH